MAGFDTDADYLAAGEVFTRAGFTEKNVFELLGSGFATDPTDADRPALLARVNGRTPLETLVRLFMFGGTAEAAEVAETVAPMDIDLWRRAGLLVRSDGLCRAAVHILPFKGLWVATDFAHGAWGTNPNRVMCIGGSTLTLANQTIRKPIGRMLDLGTGCGLHAMLAAAHAEHVVATDINPRALDMARFNARLNGLTNIEFRLGSLFEPVDGDEPFDLIVTNPPFVISPDTAYAYRDGGMELDGFVKAIVQQAPRHLTEDGLCQIICNWAHLDGEPWRQRLTGWFAHSDCDGWIIHRRTQSPEAYTRAWQDKHADEAAKADQHRRWMDYHQRMGVEGIGVGTMLLRRRTGQSNWVAIDDYAADDFAPTGDDLWRAFRCRDFAERTKGIGPLLAARLRVAPEVRLDQQCEAADGNWQVRSAQLRRVKGLTFSGPVDPGVAQLVARCDGSRQVSELLADLAAARKMPLGTITSEYLRVVRNLIARGILEPINLAG